MRPIKTTLATAAVSALMLASGPLSAAPTVSGWDLAPTGAGGLMVRIHWSEPAPVEVTEFPAARQMMLTIPGAALSNQSLTAPALDENCPVSQIRFQPVTMPDGTDAVNVTLTLSEWREMETVAAAKWLTLRPADEGNGDVVKIERQVTDAPAANPIVRPASFGSASAPASGAGQGNEAPAFWVPPVVEDPAANAPGADTGMLDTLTMLDRRIDLTDFQGAPLEDVIRSIAKQLNLNIIMDPGTLPGTVTMELYNVKLSEALDAVLKTKGKGYIIEKGGIIRIVDRKQLSEDPDIQIISKAVPVNWIDAKELETILQPFTGRSGSGSGSGGSGSGRGISVSEHSNTLIIRDTPEKVAEMQDIIRQLDIPEKQVKMEVRLVDMTEFASRRFTSEFNILRDPQIDPVTGIAMNPYNFEPPMSAELAQATSSLQLQDLISRVNPQADLGETIDLIQNSAVTLVSPEDYTIGPAGFAVDNLLNTKFLGQEYRINARLSALEERGEAVTLAAPILLTTNNNEATMEITREIPFTQGVNSDQGSVGTVEFQSVGIRVSLRPRVSNNNFVTIDIDTDQDILTGAVGAGGARETDKRTATSQVTVQDEQMFFYGGLRQFASTSGESGTPWLLRAPILSWIFKGSDAKEQNKVELFMFVKPSIVKDPTPTGYEESMFDKIQYNWDLPDYYFDEVVPRDAPGENPDPFIKR
jgi:type II secretory pathway component GspD/PulD (secretin)